MNHNLLLVESDNRRLTPWRTNAAVLPSGMVVDAPTLLNTHDYLLLGELFGVHNATSSAYINLRDAYAVAALQTTEILNELTKRI